MNHIALEQRLTARLKKRRRILGALSIGFLILAALFTILYEMSRTVEETQIGPLVHRTVRYDYDLAWGILVGAMGLTVCGILYLADRFCSRVVPLEVGGDHLTFYRGLLHTDLYINGEQTATPAFGPCLEARLSDGSRVTLVRGKWSAHLLFGDGRESIDL